IRPAGLVGIDELIDLAAVLALAMAAAVSSFVMILMLVSAGSRRLRLGFRRWIPRLLPGRRLRRFLRRPDLQEPGTVPALSRDRHAVGPRRCLDDDLLELLDAAEPVGHFGHNLVVYVEHDGISGGFKP